VGKVIKKTTPEKAQNVFVHIPDDPEEEAKAFVIDWTKGGKVTELIQKKEKGMEETAP